MWSDIFGHKRQIEEMRRALETGRLHNAYLFSGLAGIGKRRVAETFVSALFCERSPDACGACAQCAKIKNRSHPDAFFIEPKTEKILIEQVRELQQKLKFHPLEGASKVVLMDDADMLTEAAANSLLKVLEEPPRRTHFILVTAFPHKLLPTIRSRCQKMVFSPLTAGDVSGYLVAEKGMDRKEADRIAGLSEGSIGSVSELEGEFVDMVVERLKTLLAGANASDIIALAETWAKENEQPHLIIDLIMRFYRDAMYGRSTGAGSSRGGAPFLERRSISKLEQDLRSISGVRDALATTANKQLLFEQLLFTLTK